MEVHAHSHSERKKWTHYLWEFLMLFLAVFCGFLAENQREHMVEHKKEKEYLSSLIADLKYDTSQFNLKTRQFEEKFPFFDSLFVFFNNPEKFNNKLPYKYWKQTELISATYIPAEPTLQQLKSSGNFRLLSNKKVLDSMLVYESHINGSYLLQTNYVLEFYKRQLQTKEKYFDNTNFNRYLDDRYQGKIDSSDDYSLILMLTDKVHIKEIYNLYITVKSTNLYYIDQLKARRDEAGRLLTLIQKEYDLK
ncbi:MAG: hypothetical protein E6H08_02315 [Bacteroidetes bacterium]|nr:MAG: hypothetical protein E6H08_02315 [Bacteroidota bacterium]